MNPVVSSSLGVMAASPGSLLTPTEIVQPLSLKDKMNNYCCSLRTCCLVFGYVNMVLCYILTTFIFIIMSVYDADSTLILMLAIDIVLLIIIFSLHVVLLCDTNEERRRIITVIIRGMMAVLLVLLIMDTTVIIFIATVNAKHLARYLWSFFCLLVVASYIMQLAKSEKDITETSSV